VRPGLFALVAVFVRQVVAELKKVVRPSRTELVTYTTTVLVFVAIVMAFVLVVDLAVGKGVFWAFGG
jgi:preprotein translocase subunit SecE